MSTEADLPWVRLYPPGVARDITPRVSTMLEAWDTTVERRGDVAGIHYFDKSLSFGFLDRTADALAVALQARGVARGDRVAIYLQNDPQWLVSMVAAWKIGAIPVAVNPMLRDRELKHHLNDASPRVLICLDSLYSTIVRDIRHDILVESIITTHPLDLVPGAQISGALSEKIEPKTKPDDTDDWVELLLEYDGRRPAKIQLTPDDIAVLTYTSGTTGPSKGAMNLQRGMVHSSQVFAEWFSINEADTVLGMAPVFHITGMVAGMGVSILTGAPLVLLHRFDAAETLRAIERWGATFTVGASTAYIALSNESTVGERDLSTMTKVGSGGAAVGEAMIERVREATGWHVRGVYGLTETTSPTHITPLDVTPPIDAESGALSVGVPVPGVRVRIVDIEEGQDLGSGEVGEIVVSGPMVVPGYWQLPEESANAVRDGWLFTGDIGVMNDDGWLFVVDRKKDLINAGGYKIWPRDVEDVLYQHPAVKEASVVGIPDEYRGETVKAYVSLVPGKQVTSEDLILFCRDRMAAYKYPRAVEFLDELPKTASGKLLRRELRDITARGK